MTGNGLFGQAAHPAFVPGNYPAIRCLPVLLARFQSRAKNIARPGASWVQREQGVLQPPPTPPNPRLHVGGFPREVETPAPEIAVARVGTNFRIRVVCWGGVRNLFKEIVTKREALLQVWIHQQSVMKWDWGDKIWPNMRYWQNA